MTNVVTGSATIVRQPGKLFRGSLAAEDYCSHPAPPQGRAIGLVGLEAGDTAGSRLKQLLMGIGEAE